MFTANSIAQAPVGVTSRNIQIDVLKGLAILCMVLAHCGAPLGQEIYLFHMAVFFMASGYFYNQKNSDSIRSVCKYCFKKVIALYVPYVICNGLLVLFHNQMIDWNLMTSNPEFLEIGGGGAVWGLQWPYDEEFKNASLKAVLLFQKEPQLGGATWFLRALFVVSVFHCVFMYVVKKLHWPWLKTVAVIAAVIVCCMIATRIQNNQLVIIDHHKSYFAGWLAYLMGILIRRKAHLFRYDLQSCLFSAVLLYLLKSYGSISLASGHIQNLLFFAVASVLGWVLLRSAAELLSGPVAKVLAYAGKHSMSIVMLHFLSFKAVTLAIILLTDQSMVLLASFPQMTTVDYPYLWVAYTIAGTALPLSVNAVYQTVKRIIIRFMRGVYESICNRSRRPVGP